MWQAASSELTRAADALKGSVSPVVARRLHFLSVSVKQSWRLSAILNMAHGAWSCGIMGEQDDDLTVPRYGKKV
jgi:hypothetical protein